ncbi:importin subunit alpha-6 [Hyalella azteca]|uniref:Importin subunit alpha-6 n=1 Tax=Hyalella azteca TaxID=294128 RepID=A0A8B7PCP5_HYAAZ|nr:importin subunit alpha-6 [Hyalella azteca]
MAWTISNIVRPKPCQMNDEDWKKCLLMLRGYLRSSDPSVKLDAAWGLSYVSDGNSEAIQRVLDLNILKDVAEMLTSTDEKISKVSLRIAGNVVSGNDEQTDKVIAAGILPCLLDILRPENKKSSSERREAAWALSNITAGSNEQIQKVFDSGAVPILVQTMKDGTTPYAVCKEVVWCLGNSTNGDPDQIDFLVSNGVVQVFINFLTEHSDVAGPLFPVVLNFISNILEQATDVETLRRELQEHEEDLNNILDAAELRDVAPQLREKLDEFLNDVSPEEE